MNSSGGYIGPDETWRRFMAGLSVTHQTYIEDGSEWVLRPMTRYHLTRLAALIHPSTAEAVQAAVVTTINTLGAVLLGSDFRSITSSPIPDKDIAEIVSTALANLR